MVETLVATPQIETEAIFGNVELSALLSDTTTYCNLGGSLYADIEVPMQEAILESVLGGGSSATLTTDDFNYHTIQRIELENSHAYYIEVTVVATTTAGNDRATYVLGGLFYANAGQAHREGDDVSYMTTESEEDWNARFLIVGDVIEVQVNSYGSEVNWKSEKRILEA